MARKRSIEAMGYPGRNTLRDSGRNMLRENRGAGVWKKAGKKKNPSRQILSPFGKKVRNGILTVLTAATASLGARIAGEAWRKLPMEPVNYGKLSVNPTPPKRKVDWPLSRRDPKLHDKLVRMVLSESGFAKGDEEKLAELRKMILLSVKGRKTQPGWKHMSYHDILDSGTYQGLNSDMGKRYMDNHPEEAKKVEDMANRYWDAPPAPNAPTHFYMSGFETVGGQRREDTETPPWARGQRPVYQIEWESVEGPRIARFYRLPR